MYILELVIVVTLYVVVYKPFYEIPMWVVARNKSTCLIVQDQSDNVEAEPNNRTEPVLPADTPKVNVWDARKREMASRAPEKTPAPSAGYNYYIA